MPGGRVKALDGVRALAILCVLIGHSTGAGARGPHVPGWLPAPYGNFGVQVFFVLSGFLITSLLVAGPVSLRAFYRRRAYRILPPYVTMLAVAAALAGLGVVSISRGAWLSAAVFGWNYSPWANGWWLGHTWSLAVEEQFYLLWPALLLLLGARRGRVSLLWFAALAPVLRVVTYAGFPAQRGHVSAMFHTRGDALAIGCLLALAWPDPRTRALLDRLVARRVHWLAVAYLPVSWWLARHHPIGWLLPAGYTLDALAVALLIAYVMDHPPRWLTVRPLLHVGHISYSLYLWQQWFLRPGLLPSTVGVVLAFATAEVSWRLVERPALALRQRREQAVAVGRRVVDVRRDADRVAADAHVDPLRRKAFSDSVR